MIGEVLSVFIASMLRASTGFGFNLVAIPLLSFFMPNPVPLAVVLSTALSLAMAWKWKSHHAWKEVAKLVAGAAASSYLAAKFIGPASELSKFLAGLVIAGYGLYLLVSKRPFKMKMHASLWGALAGAMLAIFGIDGPPILIYVANEGFGKKEAQGIMQAFFLMNGAIASASYHFSGNFPPIASVAVLLAPLALGFMVGSAMLSSMKEGMFKKAVNWGIVILGLAMSARSLQQLL